MRSFQTCRIGACRNSGQFVKKRGTARHSERGLRTIVVSIMEKGAGSVDDSARPALPNTRTTSGTSAISRSIVCRRRDASVTESPGRVVGMYSRLPSSSGGKNSDPRLM